MKPRFYVPACLRNFQGFSARDIKDFVSEQRVEVHLEQTGDNSRTCHRCRTVLGSYHDQYRIRSKHLKMMGWTVEIVFFREKRYCKSSTYPTFSNPKDLIS